MRFLTPDSSDFSEPVECRTISLPPALWPLVNGALERLTAAYNWDAHGDATPEECTQFFMGIIDAYSESICEVSGGSMNPIEALLEIVGQYDQTTNPTGISNLLTSDLPAYAQSATTLYCQIDVVSSSGGQLYVYQNNSIARQTFPLVSDVSVNRHIIVPFNTGNTVFRVLPNPATYTVSVKLVGWW